VCPDQTGGTNWMPPSFDPSLGLFFVTRPRIVRGLLFNEGRLRAGRRVSRRAVQRLNQYSALRAIDAATRRTALGVPLRQPVVGRRAVHGIGPGLRRVVGKRDGVRCAHGQEPLALSDRLRAVCRSDQLHARWPPQYVLMPSGTTLTAFALADFR